MSSTTSVHPGSATIGHLPLFPSPEIAVSSSVHSYHAFNSSVSYPCSTIRLQTVLTINGIAMHFASIKVVSILGAAIREYPNVDLGQGKTSLELDLQDAASGQYMIVATGDEGSQASIMYSLEK